MTYLLQQWAFVLRFRYMSRALGSVRKILYSIQGMNVGEKTIIFKIYITWPNQISIGMNCYLEHDIYFKYDGVWKEGRAIRINNNVFIGSGCEFNIRQEIEIGNNSLIASGCRFIDHDHGTAIGIPMGGQPGPEEAIRLGADVWLGCNVVVLKGVVIGDGAIVAAGAIVTKSIMPNEIWAGVPARKIGERH